jgi:hypothetical protein
MRVKNGIKTVNSKQALKTEYNPGLIKATGIETKNT